MKNQFIDNYSSCEATHVTLCVYPKEGGPESVSKSLGLTPTSFQKVGELSKTKSIAQIDAWFLSSKGKVSSKDSRRHIDWILKKLEGKKRNIRGLSKKGARVELSCYWLSKTGNGGPSHFPDQLIKIGGLGIEFYYDFYSMDALDHVLAKVINQKMGNKEKKKRIPN